MEVDSSDRARHLVEADVVEPFEARSVDLPHTVVWHKKVLLPAHEDVLATCPVLAVKVRSFGLSCEWAPGGEAVPMLHVCTLVGSPILMLGDKAISGPNDLAFKVGCQTGVVFGKA